MPIFSFITARKIVSITMIILHQNSPKSVLISIYSQKNVSNFVSIDFPKLLLKTCFNESLRPYYRGATFANCFQIFTNL